MIWICALNFQPKYGNRMCISEWLATKFTLKLTAFQKKESKIPKYLTGKINGLGRKSNTIKDEN